MNQFLWGALAMAAGVAMLFFARYWTLTRDRFFLFFAAAFALLSLNWIVLGVADLRTETRHYVYILRLLAFVAIIIGILDKNRGGKAT